MSENQKLHVNISWNLPMIQEADKPFESPVIVEVFNNPYYSHLAERRLELYVHLSALRSDGKTWFLEYDVLADGAASVHGETRFVVNGRFRETEIDPFGKPQSSLITGSERPEQFGWQLVASVHTWVTPNPLFKGHWSESLAKATSQPFSVSFDNGNNQSVTG